MTWMMQPENFYYGLCCNKKSDDDDDGKRILNINVLENIKTIAQRYNELWLLSTEVIKNRISKD